MQPLSAAIFAKLSGDATLAGMLASYGSPARPAIFSIDPVPLDAAMPYVCWNGALHDEPFGGKVEEATGRDLKLDIRIYAPGIMSADGSSSSTAAIDAIAERVRALLHMTPLAVSGYTNMMARCINGPIVIQSDPQAQGRAITMEYILQ
ncbi:hypothetical protein IMX07_10940 [bacterium]|jgi:hypothetical protein|nr:hypothetical protein [bacterium]